MKKLVVVIMLGTLLLTACGQKKVTLVGLFKAKDYQWHKNTIYIKVHWSYRHPDKDTIAAEGFVEPFDPKTGLHTVRLELVGLDEGGKVVNSASGTPADNTITSPLAYSPFRLVMKLNGREKEFTIRGNYYHFFVGQMQDFSSKSFDNIPLKSDEPY